MRSDMIAVNMIAVNMQPELARRFADGSFSADDIDRVASLCRLQLPLFEAEQLRRRCGVVHAGKGWWMPVDLWIVLATMQLFATGTVPMVGEIEFTHDETRIRVLN